MSTQPKLPSKASFARGSKVIKRTKKTHLRIAVVSAEKKLKLPAALRSLFTPGDELVPTAPDQLAAGRFDAGVFLGICGSTPLSEQAAKTGLPAMAVEPYLGFHPYHAAFYRDIESRGGIVLPALNPEEIADSISALRSYRSLAGTKLLVVDMHMDDFRAEEVRRFTEGCRKHIGVEVIRRPAAEMKSRAAGYSDAQAREVLAGWYAKIMEKPEELSGDYLSQSAKLYLAERAMLDETGAAGITVEDIGAFLTVQPSEVMPNVSYGALAYEGFMAAEEGDIEVLASELLLRAGLDAQPTMSNIYLAYRDRFKALSSHTQYTPAMELEDCRQCIADNHLTAAHFSASGVLPPSMMVEKRYQVRETIPAWPGQGMIVSTPKLGPVVLARLTSDASGVHLVQGKADARLKGDKYGWYRGSWYIKIPSVLDFIRRCQHQHYAIGPENKRYRVLQILTQNLLKLAAQ